MDFGSRCKRVKKAVDHMIWPVNEDLLIKVLCCLPPKVLIRCRCVCKGWSELIDHYCVPQIAPSLPFLGCHLRIKTSANLVVDPVSLPQVEADVNAWPPVFNTCDPNVGFPRFLKDFCPRPEHLLDSGNGLMLFIHPCKNPPLVCSRTTLPAVGAKLKLLAFDPVSDDGVIIWTPNLIFCYY